MSLKPSIPKGTRDFSPQQMMKRNFIFDTLKSVFELYGFQPIETPAMENLSTLMGKYGEEGDKLLFKVLNSGDFLSDLNEQELSEMNSIKLINKIAEKGLRYDLTVPFARYVVQNQNEINFPFRRYQIQPVWRADRPQKSRYREFSQCDVDVIGSDSLLNEVELLKLIDDVFYKLGIRVTIKINNRKILTGIAELIGESGKVNDIIIALDKLDKIGLDRVIEELAFKGISDEGIKKLEPVFMISGTNEEKLGQVEKLILNSEKGMKGIAEMRAIYCYLPSFNINNAVEFDLTLARGLNYYTGSIIEVKSKDIQIGSLTGGGRYDDLTGIFGLPGISGVGISFGADRIYDVMEQMNLFIADALSSTQVLFVNFGEVEEQYIIPFLLKLRSAGIKAEIYPEKEKMKKQLNYANRKNINLVALAGESEISEGVMTVKNMETGDQEKIKCDDLIDYLTCRL